MVNRVATRDVTRSRVDQAGYAPALLPPDEFRGSPLHAQLASVVGTTHLQGFWCRHRSRFFDRYRLRKLLWMTTRRGALRRLLNFAIYLAERGRVVKVHYAPVHAIIEPGNLCQLKCPGCTTGGDNPAARLRRWTALDAMKERIDAVAPCALQVQFSHWGEPFLNPGVFEACAYAADRGIWTLIHSNFSVRIPRLAEKIVASRLCNLVVSADGATQEVYERYRKKGDLELVFENVASVDAEKRRLGRRFPWITAKFIVFDHNWHEAEAFRARALEAGADEVLFIGGLVDVVHQTGRVASEREFDLQELRYLRRRLGNGCRELWEGVSFDHDGALYPCCDAFREKDLFATAQEAAELPMRSHWNNERYQAARAFFANRSRSLEALPSPCDTCERVARHAAARAQ